MLGITVDIGTSSIVARLISCDATTPITEQRIANPQAFAGIDIISRARFAGQSAKKAENLKDAVVTVIDSAIHEMTLDGSVDSSEIKEIIVVGNTVMHHLFHGLGVSSLLEHPYIPQSCEAIAIPAQDAGLISGGSVSCYSPPLIAAFVGSDACANFAASQVWDYDVPILIMDIGVNTELLLWDGDKGWAASVASGPAFEAMALASGMQAGPGAIDRVHIGPGHSVSKFNTIAGTKPAGICGSGVISLLAEMLATGLMDETGSLTRNSDSDSLKTSGSIRYYIVAQEKETKSGSSIYITQPEIRELQLAKSAVAAGLFALFREAKTDESEISQIHTTGSFGSSLDLRDATRIGMLPVFKNAEHIARADGASLGAAEILCSLDSRHRCEQLASNVRYVDLEHNTYFNQAFPVTRLFKPWGSLLKNIEG